MDETCVVNLGHDLNTIRKYVLIYAFIRCDGRMVSTLLASENDQSIESRPGHVFNQQVSHHQNDEIQVPTYYMEY